MFWRPSIITALVLWAAIGFVAQPSVASLAVWILLVPLLIALLLYIHRWELHSRWQAERELEERSHELEERQDAAPHMTTKRGRFFS